MRSPLNEPSLNRYDAVSWGLLGNNETARVHLLIGGAAVAPPRRVRAAANAGSRLFQQRHAIGARQKSGGVSQRFEEGRAGRKSGRCDRVRLGGKSFLIRINAVIVFSQASLEARESGDKEPTND